MGKYILILTLSLAFAITVIASQGVKTDLDTSEDQTERQEMVLARDIAQSAFEMGMSELRRDFQNWRVERDSVPYENGSFDLTATGPANGPVALTAVGRLSGAEYKITGTVKKVERISSLFNGITAAGNVGFNVSGPGCSGGPCVSGIDAGDGENRRGISLPNTYVPDEEEEDDDSDDDISETEGDVCAEFDDKVEGRGEGCDVKGRTEGADDWVQREMKILEKDIKDMVQSNHPDVTVCRAGGNGNGNSGGNGNGNSRGNGNGNSRGNCRMNGNSTRSGILYVKGDFTFNGQAQWNGPVYVDEGGSVRINGGGGTRNINGSLLMEEDTELDMNGGNRIQYNSDNVMDFVNPLPSISTTVVKVTERSGTLLSSSE